MPTATAPADAFGIGKAECDHVAVKKKKSQRSFFIYLSIYLSIYTHTHIHTHIYIYIYIHIYKYIYIYIYITILY